MAIRAGLTANWLSLGRNIDVSSQTISLLAMAALLWLDLPGVVRTALLCAVLAGLAEKFFALRVAFDRKIFGDWARRWEKIETVSPTGDLGAFDAALATAGLHRTSNPGGRSLDDRIRGAMKLLTWQAGLFIIQSLAILVAILCRHGS